MCGSLYPNQFFRKVYELDNGKVKLCERCFYTNISTQEIRHCSHCAKPLKESEGKKADDWSNLIYCPICLREMRERREGISNIDKIYQKYENLREAVKMVKGV